MPMPDPRVGEVWDVDVDPTMRNEQGGTRPALVISVAEFNAIAPPEGGLTTSSVLTCEQAKSRSLIRFKRKRGEVGASALETVQRLVGTFIGR